MGQSRQKDDDECVAWRRVFAIVRYAGGGKTTLAREVCHAIGGYFDCCVWVSIWPNRRLQDILVDILGQLEEEEDHPNGEDRVLDLTKKIKESLQHKRLLEYDQLCFAVQQFWQQSSYNYKMLVHS
ncbi:hypothetical protein EJB05_26625, partial [Eragrostis curvula]